MRDTEIVCTCPFCGGFHSVMVDMDDYGDWMDGTLAQHAFPYLTPTEREQLISNICPKCQESIFGAEDDPEPPDDCDYEVGFDPYSGCFTDDC